MSLLGTMEIVGTKTADGELALKYNYVDYVIKGYSGQDHIQVGALIQAIKDDPERRTRHPNVNKLILQSDGASCLSSAQHIPLIFALNYENPETQIVRWIYTEAQTGKSRLDTHFSFLNLKFKAYVLDGNAMTTEDGIMKALKFQNGIAGTTVKLINLSLLDKKLSTVTGKFLPLLNKCKLGTRSIHDIQFLADCVHVRAQSQYLDPVIFRKGVLERFTKCDLPYDIEDSFTSSQPGLVIPIDPATQSPTDASQEVNPSARATAIHEALVSTDPVLFGGPPIGPVENPFPQQLRKTIRFRYGWAKDKTVAPNDMKYSTAMYLHHLFMKEEGNKSLRISCYRGHQLLLEDQIRRDWGQRMIVTPWKVKAWFSKKASEQLKAMKKLRGSPPLTVPQQQPNIVPIEGVDVEDDQEDADNAELEALHEFLEEEKLNVEEGGVDDEDEE